jgi:hypothetical protein
MMSLYRAQLQRILRQPTILQRKQGVVDAVEVRVEAVEDEFRMKYGGVGYE